MGFHSALRPAYARAPLPFELLTLPLASLAATLTAAQVGPVVFAFGLEHVLIILKWIVRSVTPDVPADVAEDNYRERYACVARYDHVHVLCSRSAAAS